VVPSSVYATMQTVGGTVLGMVYRESVHPRVPSCVRHHGWYPVDIRVGVVSEISNMYNISESIPDRVSGRP
jgi:hypothetical protein